MRLKFRNAAPLFIVLLTSPAFAATQLQVLFDIDNSSATGCTVSGMPGVERVITTSVDTNATPPRVTSVSRADCSGGTLTSAVMIDTTGWPATFDPTTGIYSVETRAPYSIFGNSVPSRMRVGFVLTNGTQTVTILTDADGNALLLIKPAKRRIVNTPIHPFNLDGHCPL